jgi:uncharacterized membrane protein YgcG
MKKIFFLFFVITCLNVSAQQLVYDYAGALTQSQQHSLENDLKDFNDKGIAKMAVLVVPTPSAYDSIDAVQSIMNQWKTSDKNFSKGIVLVISVSSGFSRAAIITEPGSKRVISDSVGTLIVMNEMLPVLEYDKFYRAAEHAIKAIDEVTKGKYTPGENDVNKIGSKGDIVFVLIFGSFLVSIILFAKPAKDGVYLGSVYLADKSDNKPLSDAVWGDPNYKGSIFDGFKLIPGLFGWGNKKDEPDDENGEGTGGSWKD